MRDDELLVGGKSGFGARRTRLRDANDPVRVGPLRCMGLCLGKVTGHGARQLRAAIGLSIGKSVGHSIVYCVCSSCCNFGLGFTWSAWLVSQLCR